jgi:nucleotidyltransferase substrate binding protein (TIGR01987 family)
MKKDDISHYRFIKDLSALPFIDELWLYGSRARGDFRDRSDIDLALVCPTATEEDWRAVMDIIDERDTLLSVDCVRFDKKYISEALYNNIAKDKKVIYMNTNELDWKDRFESLGKAVDRLNEVMHHPDIDTSTFMRDAAIQRFEFTIELFWKVLKKILQYEKVDANSPRDVLQKAFQIKLIDDEAMWLSMLDDRNNTSHVYKEEDADRIFMHSKLYLSVFERTYQKLKAQYRL